MMTPPSATPRTDKLYDQVADREQPVDGRWGNVPSKWSYEAILDLTDFARQLERELADRATPKPAQAEPVANKGELSMDVSKMVDRFLAWPLPKDFGPDCYITFDRAAAETNNCWPIGTNLFTADQARQMIEHLIAAPPSPAAEVETLFRKATGYTVEEYKAMEIEVKNG